MSWDEVKARLAEAKTQAERQAAAEALIQHMPPHELNKSLVSLQKGGVHVVSLRNLTKEMAHNPEVYDRVRKIVTGR